MSTAETAMKPRPGRPAFRIALPRRLQTAAGAMASDPRTSCASIDATKAAVEASAYVYPRPVRPPPCTSTTTIVVESHSCVPSDSGSPASTGMVYAATSRPSTRTSGRTLAAVTISF